MAQGSTIRCIVGDKTWCNVPTIMTDRVICTEDQLMRRKQRSQDVQHPRRGKEPYWGKEQKWRVRRQEGRPRRRP